MQEGGLGFVPFDLKVNGAGVRLFSRASPYNASTILLRGCNS